MSSRVAVNFAGNTIFSGTSQEYSSVQKAFFQAIVAHTGMCYLSELRLTFQERACACILGTAEPRYNEPLFNEILAV